MFLKNINAFIKQKGEEDDVLNLSQSVINTFHHIKRRQNMRNCMLAGFYHENNKIDTL